ncbi:MAG: TonB family protein [Bacteroidota bacterium]
MLDYNSKNITLDDIVFENRNKTYGAYLIRKLYDDNVLKALAIAGTLFVLAIAGPIVYASLKPVEEAPVEEIVREVNLAPPPPMPSAPPPPQVTTVKFLPPEIKPDEEVKEDPPKQEELVKAVAGTESVKGDSTADPNTLVIEPGDGGNGVIAPPAEEIFTVVEQPASFPGGPEEMMKFLKKNIKYPYRAQKAEVSGRVFVEFVVGQDGKIRDIKVARGIGYGCDEEAIRVVGMMPDWSPPKQAGRNVSQKMIIPVNYKLGDSN